MTKKDEQRIEMRDKILEAAIVTYAEMGFAGASTREIAKRADTSQGLLTYHFKNKNELWFAAVDRMFETFEQEFGENFFASEDGKMPADIDVRLKRFLEYNSRNPHLLKFVIDSGKELNERSKYLVDNHLRPVFEDFKTQLPKPLQDELAPHVFYAWLGAATTIFSIPAECEYLTGINPHTPEAIERHADLIVHLFVPGNVVSMIWKAFRGGLASYKPKD